MWRASFATVCLLVALSGCKGEKRSPLLEAARNSTHDSELAPPIPIFSVRNLPASQRYFREVLGFKQEWEYGEPPAISSVSRADARLFICAGCEGNPGAWVMLFTRDVDKLHEELAAKKAIIKMPPTDMPWRLREMHVADPDGNVMRFATAIKD